MAHPAENDTEFAGHTPRRLNTCTGSGQDVPWMRFRRRMPRITTHKRRMIVSGAFWPGKCLPAPMRISTPHPPPPRMLACEPGQTGQIIDNKQYKNKDLGSQDFSGIEIVVKLAQISLNPARKHAVHRGKLRFGEQQLRNCFDQSPCIRLSTTTRPSAAITLTSANRNTLA
jgi:hypothetical protein